MTIVHNFTTNTTPTVYISPSIYGSPADMINATGMGQLRQLYREALRDGSFSDAGGANLGLIDIARKAGGQMQYGFDAIDEDHSYFILKINIDAVME